MINVTLSILVAGTALRPQKVIDGLDRKGFDKFQNGLRRLAWPL